jgi:hypothetical protein
MTKLPINYQKACIYEIVCKDVNITERYVGSTTNLIKRRYHHKNNCNNENSKAYSFYVYQFIRDNGSFENWDVVLIEQVIDCKDKENLHKRERYYIEEKKAELNKQKPLRTIKEWCKDNKKKIKDYCVSNKKKIAEQQRIYYEENKVVIAETAKKYKQNNKNKITEYNRAYRKNNLSAADLTFKRESVVRNY